MSSSRARAVASVVLLAALAVPSVLAAMPLFEAAAAPRAGFDLFGIIQLIPLSGAVALSAVAIAAIVAIVLIVRDDARATRIQRALGGMTTLLAAIGLQGIAQAHVSRAIWVWTIAALVVGVGLLALALSAKDRR